MDSLEVNIESYRKSLIKYVYRITGSIEESKDIVQDTMLKYISYNKEIENPKSWLFKVATNLSFDFLKKAKTKRETYIGTRLPEPFIQEESNDLTINLELDESLSMALLVLLEKLSIKERVAYILHDIFEFKHKEIALILDTSLVNTRQFVSRANKKLKEKRNRNIPSKEEHERLIEGFMNALKKGDLENLKSMFREDIELYSDGGGKAIAARKVIYGNNDFIGKFLIKVVSSQFLVNKNLRFKAIKFNGSLGILLLNNNKVETSYSFEIKDSKIIKIFALRNPDKLKYFTF